MALSFHHIQGTTNAIVTLHVDGLSIEYHLSTTYTSVFLSST